MSDAWMDQEIIKKQALIDDLRREIEHFKRLVPSAYGDRLREIQESLFYLVDRVSMKLSQIESLRTRQVEKH